MKLGPETNWLDMRLGCGYNPAPGWDPADECGAEATLHVALAEGNNGARILACAKHEHAAIAIQGHIDHHPVGTWCPMPGALWIAATEGADSHCVLDGSGVEPAHTGACAVEVSAS